MPVTVPGTVHVGLEQAGKIADPLYGRNELDVQWIDEQDWEFTREFAASGEDCGRGRQQLIFDGLDTVATIWLNGKKIGASVNMHRQVVCDVRGVLQPGENQLRIVFAAPTPFAQKQAKLGNQRVWRDKFKWQTGEEKESARQWIRKTQCHFGWDWGLYLATCGVWQSVGLDCSDAPRISAVKVLQEHVGPAGRPKEVRLTVTAYLDSPTAARGQLKVVCDRQTVVVPARAGKGESEVEAKLTIKRPRLWWPNGDGEQVLYPISVQWDEEPAVERRIGLRTLEVIRKADKSPKGEPGESFYFQVNGRPVFAKGANWVPADQFIERCTPGVYRHLLKSMAETHQNMVRIWGGGWYEPHIFYDICDELGILVWQDFMMACAVYPDTKDFIAEMTAEARYQVRRLHTHPCIALWCGDNENAGAIWEWRPYQADRKKNVIMYKRLMDALRKAVVAEDTSRPFWLSSPSNDNYDGHPGSADKGDVHYWNVWHGKAPFKDYLNVKPRFSSEFGFQSFAEPRTMRDVVPAGELNPSSWTMEHHQRAGDGNMLITNTIARELPLPDSFDNYCWASQINQAMGVRFGVEHWRRLRPWCMGTLYWQINDIWPVASWASIDYHGRWKALHHWAGRFFAPVLASFSVENDRVEVWVTSDLAKSVSLKGEIEAFTWEGKRVGRKAVVARVRAGQSRAVASFDVEEILGGLQKRDVCLFVRLRGDGVEAENFTTLVPWKWVALARPKMEMELRETKGGIELVASSAQVAAFFHAELEGLEGHFEGDWAVMRPGEKYRMRWVAHTDRGAEMPSLAEARKRLRTLSLYETYTHG